MKFELNEIILWGRSYDEYLKMFSLTDKELELKMLSVADGPANFNSELNSKGGFVTSIDPIYQFTSHQIQTRINEIYETVLEEAQKNKDKFIWNNIHSIEELGNIRMQAMQSFLLDFENGKEQKRYIAAELPNLPFKKPIMEGS